jgi:hypothetical protein
VHRNSQPIATWLNMPPLVPVTASKFLLHYGGTKHPMLEMQVVLLSRRQLPPDQVLRIVQLVLERARTAVRDRHPVRQQGQPLRHPQWQVARELPQGEVWQVLRQKHLRRRLEEGVGFGLVRGVWCVMCVGVCGCVCRGGKGSECDGAPGPRPPAPGHPPSPTRPCRDRDHQARHPAAQLLGQCR